MKVWSPPYCFKMGAGRSGSSHVSATVTEDWTCLWADLASALKVSVPNSVTVNKMKVQVFMV